jgi:hypothetical protein
MGRPHGEITFINRQTIVAAVQDNITAAQLKFKPVAEIELLHAGNQLMVAIIASAYHMQAQVYFGRGRQRNLIRVSHTGVDTVSG